MRRLDVGSIVRLGLEADDAGPTYRVEQLLPLADGATLYKVKCEAEPFDRIVSEGDVATRPQ